MSNKKYTVQDFESIDILNSQVIHVHSLMHQVGNLLALKCYRSIEVLEGLGGFKLMYPLIHLIMKSNLKELDPDKPGLMSGTLIAKVF